MTTSASVAAAACAVTVAALTVLRLAAPWRLPLGEYTRGTAVLLFMATGALGGGGQIAAAICTGTVAVGCAVSARWADNNTNERAPR